MHPEKQPAPVADSPPVVFRDVQVGYGRHVVLHHISATIEKGSCVAITGNNGSGKSTLIKALIGTVPLQAGTMEMLGYVRSADEPPKGPAPWSRLGYVPQRLAAAGGVEATVEEIIQTGLLGPKSFWLRRGWRDHVQDAMEQVGLAHRRKESFQVLSGGQQQRVLIARALVRDPDLLILDEPLTGLDEHNRHRLAEIIEARLGGGGTALIVLHELGELRPLITREIRIGAGHVIHDGPCTHKHHRDSLDPWIDPHAPHGHDDGPQTSPFNLEVYP